MVRFPALRFTAQGIRNGTTCVWIPRDDGTARASGIPVPTERPRYPCQKFLAVLGYPEEEVLAVGVSKPWATRRRQIIQSLWVGFPVACHEVSVYSPSQSLSV